jgi:hypothetical protein
LKKQIRDVLHEIPANELWLYEMLDQIRDPPFGTIFWIVAKVYLSTLIIGLVLTSLMFVVGFILLLVFGGALLGFLIGLWNYFISNLVQPSYNFLMPFI